MGNKKKIGVGVIVVGIFFLTVLFYAPLHQAFIDPFIDLSVKIQSRLVQKKETQTGVEQPNMNVSVQMPQIVATNLEVPWEIVFLPDETMIISQRTGSLVHVDPQQRKQIPVQGVEHIGEGGLLGVALHPDFLSNQELYVYITVQKGNEYTNQIERFRLEDDQLLDRQVILSNIPGAALHDGGRILFGPDGKLYITTGDAGHPASAQDTSQLSGKILRLNDDGTVPADNPFGNAVYSYGHRNPQGLAWDEDGNMWATEHGPSGLESGFDEINLIVRGGNYGWPTISGDKEQDGLISPVIHSGENETWAPTGLVALNDTLIFAGLRGEALYLVKRNASELEAPVALFKNTYGRLRAVTIGPDNFLFFSSSNTDGRGSDRIDDDHVYTIDPAFL